MSCPCGAAGRQMMFTTRSLRPNCRARGDCSTELKYLPGFEIKPGADPPPCHSRPYCDISACTSGRRMMREIWVPMAASSLRADDGGADLWATRAGAVFDGRGVLTGFAADDGDGAVCACGVGATVAAGTLGFVGAGAVATAGGIAGTGAVATGGAAGVSTRVSAVVVAATGGMAAAALDAFTVSTAAVAAVSELVRVCAAVGSGIAGTAKAESVIGCGEIGAGGSITGSGAASVVAATGAATGSLTLVSRVSGSGRLTSLGRLSAWVCA
ncbi:hypothetical protein BRAS3809_2100030 [Bradyrhizobium sp. STM 3809]|nr:hypothetical protein BRAS3809_2100030 [Bradyrhizobium sp. STM 3809]